MNLLLANKVCAKDRGGEISELGFGVGVGGVSMCMELMFGGSSGGEVVVSFIGPFLPLATFE